MIRIIPEQGQPCIPRFIFKFGGERQFKISKKEVSHKIGMPNKKATPTNREEPQERVASSVLPIIRLSSVRLPVKLPL